LIYSTFDTANRRTEGIPDVIKLIATLGAVVTFALASGAVPTSTLPAFAAIDGPNGQLPTACAATEQAWWARHLHAHAQSDGARGVDLASSIPALGSRTSPGAMAFPSS
jgi:hypothetical protein